jgi:hypothetical protein
VCILSSALDIFSPIPQPAFDKFIQHYEMSKLNEEIDKKGPREGVPQPTESHGVENGEMPHRIREDETILGITRESSGWDVYNNEARKVDMELVKDWTASLNFLLLFVSLLLVIYTYKILTPTFRLPFSQPC